MCNKDNIEVISEKLLDCLESTNEDDFSKKSHVHRIVHLAQQYPFHAIHHKNIISGLINTMGALA